MQIKKKLETNQFPDNKNSTESEDFLTTQLITYIGNKRALLDFIEEAVKEVKENLQKSKLFTIDIFSGSGVVARLLKKHSYKLIANDLEGYSYTINKCYLTNQSEYPRDKIKQYISNINNEIEIGFKTGFFQELYAPRDDQNIQLGERVFFTTRNAKFIDTARQLIEKVPLKYRHFVLAPLITEVSIKNNTSGVFKGFYKNSITGIGQFGGNNKDALKRIKNDIVLREPIFSHFDCEVSVYQEDANKLVDKFEEADLVYMDPPYNQHPYGSNYFMLNLLNEYKKPTEISPISGIPKIWNRSNYNKSKEAYDSLLKLCLKIKAKYLLISFNSEGFIGLEDMLKLLSQVGVVKVMEMKYNTFRGSRNLRNREIHVIGRLILLIIDW